MSDEPPTETAVPLPGTEPPAKPPSGGEGPETLTSTKLPLSPRGVVITEPESGTLTSTQLPLSPRGAAAITEPPPGDPGEIPASLHARFENFQVVGRGGMGTVYRARDLRLGRTVAVKLLSHEGAAGSLLREARSQARLTHPNICEVYEAGTADHVPFIVMRFIDGAPLSQLRAEMSLEEKVSAVRDAALALHEAHRTGLIHRDVKPSNLLVERGEDGQYRTFVCDFGIARDTSDTGATITGAVHGTPAYMSPEQAQGKARSLDRRSDVYGLGATLYDTIAGSPPITAPSVMELLRAVIEAEPKQLRAAAPATPVDLDAIVMRCLEKDPGGRYESAKALAEDLQRFLDGDPVRARPTSWGARVLRRARKHRGKVAVGAAAVLAGLTLGGLWIRDRRAAAERAAIAREMAGAVREVELFLRAAHTLPLHDVERERDVVRAKLRDIESRRAAVGEIGEGPAEDALGRGYLALEEPQTAIVHLEAAKKAGEDAPGLDYAIGLARIALYREGLEKAGRIQNEGEKKAFLAEIEREHKEPALAHLEAAITRGVESPAYAHGLVALTEGRPEEALARAKEAFDAAPWLYEAKKLEGDALLALGNETGHDKAFDAARAKGYYDRAAEAYRAASDVGRSDPEVYVAECELWTKVMYATSNSGGSMRPDFERAKGACERAITASSRSNAGRVKLAFAHNAFAFWVTTSHHADRGSPEQALSEAAKRVEEAVAANPEDAFSAYLSGMIWRSKAYYDAELGQDEGPAADRSIRGYKRALTLSPTFTWAMNEGCGILVLRGRREARLGQDPAATYAEALALCRRATEIDPSFVFPRGNELYLFADDAERRKDVGQSPSPAVEDGLRVIADVEKIEASWPWAPYYRAVFARIESEYELLKGGDPEPALARERAAFSKLAGVRESFSEADLLEGELAVMTAEWLLSKMGAPDPVKMAVEAGGEAQAKKAAPAPVPELEEALSRGRAVYAKLSAGAPWDVEPALGLARVALAELRYRFALGTATLALGDAALAPLTPFLSAPRVDPRLHALAARAHEARAALQAGRGGAEIGACVEEAEKAVAVGPGFPEGHAVLGRCRLSKSRVETDPERKKEAARLAVQALEAAGRANPLLGSTHAPLLSLAKRLSEGR